MKKLLTILLIGSLVLTGCSFGKSDALSEFSKKVEESNSYYLEGQMEIINNEDTYTYDVNVSYKKDDNYLVELNNISNNHQQVILRNSDGVYVITPSLNKSFKFQSNWPYNNSQAYLLSSIVDDLNNDENRVVEEKDGGYVLTSTVNYPNNKKLVKQLVTLDKDFNIKEAQVLDENNNMQIKMTFSKIDLKAKFDDNKFNINNFVTTNENANVDNNQDSNTTENNTNTDSDSNTNTNSNNTNSNNTNKNTNTNTNSNTDENNNNTDDNSTNKNNNTNNNTTENNNEQTQNTKTTATIDDVIYPMYLPTNTYLKSQEKVDKEDGERLILTFDGDSPFILIEETVDKSDEHVVIPTFGDLTQLSDTIGVVNDNSVNWYSSGIEYYVFSDKMDTHELLEIARSISVIPVSK